MTSSISIADTQAMDRQNEGSEGPDHPVTLLEWESCCRSGKRD